VARNNNYLIGKSGYEHFKKYNANHNNSSHRVSSHYSVPFALRQRDNDEWRNEWKDKLKL
jgi:hypothetical protein